MACSYVRQNVGTSPSEPCEISKPQTKGRRHVEHPEPPRRARRRAREAGRREDPRRHARLSEQPHHGSLPSAPGHHTQRLRPIHSEFPDRLRHPGHPDHPHRPRVAPPPRSDERSYVRQNVGTSVDARPFPEWPTKSKTAPPSSTASLTTAAPSRWKATPPSSWRAPNAATNSSSIPSRTKSDSTRP